MKIMLFLCTLLLLQSCSTQSKSKIYGAVTGSLICGTLGAYLGKEIGPQDKLSMDFNKKLGAGIGALTCGLGGYYIGKNQFDNSPENIEYKPIDFNLQPKTNDKQESLNESNGNISFSDLSIVKTNESNIPLISSLPDELKSKVQRQTIIKYKIKAQNIKLRDGRTIYFSGGSAIEHKYEKAQ